MDKLLEILESRFEKNTHRHPGLKWSSIQPKLDKDVLNTLKKMEDTLGKPDVMLFNDEIYYVDFSEESPMRRGLCYDEKAWHDRKKFKPESSVEKDILKLGAKLVDESMYMYMQSLEDLDTKTSSWIDTPKSFRDLGGALNAEKRYKRTFIFHNGADSYYASRGYRAYIKI